MQEKKVTVALIQSSVSEDLDLNLLRTMEKVKEAASQGAKIVCLQELFRTRYFPQWDQKDAAALAEAIPGPSTEAFSALAKELAIVVIVPVFERDEVGFYNSVAVIDVDGSLLPTYRKVHIPHDPLFYEKSYFTPGEEIRVYDTRYAKFAALICYDQWFPEAARVAALAGGPRTATGRGLGVRVRGQNRSRHRPVRVDHPHRQRRDLERVPDALSL